MGAAVAGVVLAGGPVSPAGAQEVDPGVAGLPSRVVLTTTVGGRPIVAHRQGAADASRVLLVIGQLHGNERDAPSVVRELRRRTVPAGVQVWTIATLNPDGRAAGTRANARGVDLNRNFPQRWFASSPASGRWSGPGPASERETMAAMEFLRLLRPDAVLSYHQPFAMVDVTGDKTRPWARLLARWTGLRAATASCVTRCGGTLTGWFNASFPGWAITIELPGGTVDRSLVARNADAALRVALRIDDV